MAKSAFEEYPRETAVRLILTMGGAGAVLVIAGFVAHITTFWAAGSILVLFAVASWPKQAAVKSADTTGPGPSAVGPTPSRPDEVPDDAGCDAAILASAKAQLESLRARLARQRGEKLDSNE